MQNSACFATNVRKKREAESGVFLAPRNPTLLTGDFRSETVTAQENPNGLTEPRRGLVGAKRDP